MSTALHSERSQLLAPKLSVARLRGLAARQLPVTLSLGAVILSVLGVRL
ncbi:hypothetical protein M2165_003855 [Variovorax sp. TBS-050B]|nr:hypothetical protein [Variovorax sp. TBS-050B]MDH6593966.1 hypothetical protein [Variovorax sp. TBS-050B]